MAAKKATRSKKKTPATTPMMAQLKRIKQDYPDELLAFRVGDFYEFYGEDALRAAPVLNIVLTARAIRDEKIPMCGVPHHAINAYLKKLVDAGMRVALCDQVEDPAKTKTLVKRDVVRVVTRGTLVEEDWLDSDRNNFLAAVFPADPKKRTQAGLAWADISTGLFYAMDVDPGGLFDELARIKPAEIIIPMADGGSERASRLNQRFGVVRDEDPALFSTANADKTILDTFHAATLDGFQLHSGAPSTRAAGALIRYLIRTHGGRLSHLSAPTPPPSREFLQLDESALANLEILQTSHGGKKRGALLGVIDKTKTAPGARLLRAWLTRPLLDIDAMDSRLDAVSFLHRDASRREDLRAALSGLPDLERVLAKMASGRATPKDLAALRAAFSRFPDIQKILDDVPDPILTALAGDIVAPPELLNALREQLVDDPPVDIEKGSVIRDGVHAELDRLRDVRSGGKKWLVELEHDEQQATGIPSLKVKYNRVFGYYIEVTKAHLDKVPPHYIRKQTTVNSERYITPRLKEIEEDLLHADVQIIGIEKSLFQNLIDSVVQAAPRIKSVAGALATLDVLASLAQVAADYRWHRPELVAEPVLRISSGRHPVIEAALPAGSFVPNDVDMTNTAGRIMLITGPNMAGKSTYIRQTALIVILAQMGSFVPAESARIGIVDRIFTRIGAGDNLTAGQSTFMVEMTETARILNNVTSASLVILDEVGRGTSTYDGLSLAWAITEYLHDSPGKNPRTLFATHYHELTELADTCRDVANYNVAVKEWNNELRFLHRIMPGPADKSYGIGVARLAGLPASVIARAKDILVKLESVDAAGQFRDRIKNAITGYVQPPLFQQSLPSPVLEDLCKIDPDAVSPREAWELLSTFIDRAKKEWDA